MTPKSALSTLAEQSRYYGKEKKPMLGSGVYSRVYEATNPHHVRKVCWRGDRAYETYVAWLKESNVASKFPFFPRLFADYIVHTATSDTATRVFKLAATRVFKLERLNRIPDTHIPYEAVFNMERHAIYAQRERQVPLDAYNNDYQGLLSNPDSQAGWLRFLLALANNEFSQPFCLDIHLGNIMLRGKSSKQDVVLTDPIVF